MTFFNKEMVNKINKQREIIKKNVEEYQKSRRELEPDEGSVKWGITTSQSYFPKDNTEFFENKVFTAIAEHNEKDVIEMSSFISYLIETVKDKKEIKKIFKDINGYINRMEDESFDKIVELYDKLYSNLEEYITSPEKIRSLIDTLRDYPVESIIYDKDRDDLLKYFYVTTAVFMQAHYSMLDKTQFKELVYKIVKLAEFDDRWLPTSVPS